MTGTIREPSRGSLRILAPGNVRVQGAPVERLTYTLQVQANAPGVVLPPAVLFWRRVNGVLTVELRNTSNEAHYDLQFKVPQQFSVLAVEAVGGDVAAYDLEIPLQVRAGGGKLQADRVASLEAESWGGEVRLGKVNGSVKVRAGGGNLSVEEVRGEMWLETGGGDIVVRRVDGALHAATGAGNIHADSIGGIGELRTAGGRIEVGEASGVIVAESQGGVIAIGRSPQAQCVSAAGAIRLREASAVQAETAIGSITADLTERGVFRGGTLRTGQGDITVSIPSKLSITVVARSATAQKRGNISSEFPGLRLERHGAAGNSWSIGQLKVNGGGPLLQIETSGGAIYLRRQR